MLEIVIFRGGNAVAEVNREASWDSVEEEKYEG
jgi:hypothetical protein